jgi:hypothetical protein
MPVHNAADWQSWLALLCRMLPGVRQAVLITDSDAGALISWPEGSETDGDVIAAARLAGSQRKNLTTTLSSGQGDDALVDMVIASPLRALPGFGVSLAVLVNIRPSQQSLVTQVLRWGEDWMALLLQQREPASASAAGPGTPLLRGGKPRLVVIGVLVLLGLMTFLSGTYRVTATANLEGSAQRAIVAPYDGYIAAAYARAGETVSADEVIAELDTEELQLQQQRYAAEKLEYSRQYRKALAARDQTQAHIFKSQVSQADAQLDLVQKKIQRSALKSSLDGIIISGDLSRSLGAPVETGEVLFEVSPLDEYRLIILVNEKQVVDVAEGMRGILTLKSMPAREIAFVVRRVSPVFEESLDGIAYRVEAGLVEKLTALRPGMQGIARIDIDERSYLWIYLHELFDLIRFWAWRWLP